MLSDTDIKTLYRDMWQTGFGSINADEAIFLRDTLSARNAKIVLEFGTATGLSSVFLIKFLQGQPGAFFRTVDTDHTFWNDRSKPTGYLIDEHVRAPELDFAVLRGKSSLDTGQILAGRKADFIFIDANHQHPWPLIDTLLNLNHLAPGGVIAHHDLDLFRKQEVARGIGPKYLFDQIPDDLLITSAKATNIYAFRHPGDIKSFAARIADGFLLPWTHVQPLDPAFIRHCEAYFAHYSDAVVQSFKTGVARFATRH